MFCKVVCTVLILFLFLSCEKIDKDHTYRFAVYSLPKKIDPYADLINAHQVLYSHLFSPMFTSNGRESQFFDLSRTHAIDSSFDKFMFCLSPQIKFSNSVPITSSDVVASFREIYNFQKFLTPIKEIEKVGDECVLVQLKFPDPMFFDKLSSFRETITEKGEGTNGLGPFYLKSLDSKIAVLDFNNKFQTKFYNKINLVKVNEGDNVDVSMFDDFNYAAGLVKVSSEELKTFQSFKIRGLKVYYVILKIYDLDDRKTVYNCLNTDVIKDKFPIGLTSLNQFLPMGLLPSGSDYAFPDKKCIKPSLKKNIKFYCVSTMCDALEASLKQSPIKNITIVREVPSVIIENTFKKNELLSILSNDSSQVNAYEYFNIITDKMNFTLDRHPLLESILQSTSQLSTVQKMEAFRKTQEYISNNFLFLPLGQSEQNFYYKKNIRNIKIENEVVRVPHVNEMELE